MTSTSCSITSPSPLHLSATPCYSSSSSRAEQWFVEHGSNYVAHAVHAPNVTSVLKDGKIMSSEQVLREKGSVEYEEATCGTGRATRYLPLLRAEHLQALNEIFENGHKGAIPGKHGATICNSTILETSFNLHHSLGEYGYAGSMSTRIRFQELLATLSNIYHSTPSIIAIAYDMSRPPEHRVDKIISELYQSTLQRLEREKGLIEEIEKIRTAIENAIMSEWDLCEEEGLATREKVQEFKFRFQHSHELVTEYLVEKYGIEKVFCFSKEHLEKSCAMIRESVFPAMKMNAEIRTYKGVIAWGYGDFVVLQGNPDKVIGLASCRGETFLLRPWQNNGDFFALELDDPDVLILCPQRCIDEHYAESGARFYRNLCAIECLTPEQQQLLLVPARLR